MRDAASFATRREHVGAFLWRPPVDGEVGPKAARFPPQERDQITHPEQKRNRKMKTRIKAFTLIELLIVIAIIAILALIAIPNFLEAQVRAKVSRTKADMRSAATALEAYQTDFNVPPLGETQAAYMDLPYASADQLITIRAWCWSHLTTPIAYTTSPCVDPFNLSLNAKNEKFTLCEYEATYNPFPGAPGSGGNTNFKKAAAAGFRWTVLSVGPAKLKAISNGIRLMVDPAAIEFYDPTNGTLSHGPIINSNKGFSGAMLK